MSEYTSTIEGYQRAMESSLASDPRQWVEATALPTFYQIMNGERVDYEAYVKHIGDMQANTKDYKPIVQQFLRDGDQLAARVKGSLNMGGTDIEYEAFMFAKVDKETGKMEWLIERAVTSPAGSGTGGAN
ncbi:hypothetical protein R3P38DRAFT_3352397 [Favolaschia claudopus]|uniref:Uncharacterized protein n=1 Tax=Favolaschia claudopus TaxID=2862362 RepID=A0AAW0C183_9AGAR